MKKSLIFVCLYSVALCIIAGCSPKTKAPEEAQQAPAAETQGEKPDAPTANELPSEKAAAVQPAVAAVKYQSAPAPRITRSDVCPDGAFMAGKDIYQNEDFWRCSCFYGDYDAKEGMERYGTLRMDGSDVLGSDFKCFSAQRGDHEWGQEAACIKVGGCKTLDGKWYEPLGIASAVIEFVPAHLQDYSGKSILSDITSPEYMDTPYITGGMDTSLYSDKNGNCVLDRTDGIPLFSDAPNAKEPFACNVQTCPCGSSQCVNGQLCKEGKCEWDKQDAVLFNAADADSFDSSSFDYFPLYTNDDDLRAKLFADMQEDCKRLNNPDVCKVKKEGDEVLVEVHYFDAKKCNGGKFYCHGRENFPIVKPEDSYYQCLPTDIFGRENSKAWLCADEEGCACGTGKCPNNAACIDGQCYCGEDAYADGIPVPEGYGCDYTDKSEPRSILRCEKDDCKCGDHTYGKGYQCDLSGSPEVLCGWQSRPSKDGKPDPNYVCEKDEWVCVNPEGCDCDGFYCPDHAACGEKGCSCQGRSLDYAMKGYRCTSDGVECMAESCLCDGKKVSRGEQCEVNKCGIEFGMRKDWRTNEPACMCNGAAMDSSQYGCIGVSKDKTLPLCMDEDGCKCGKNKCAYMALCNAGTCVDRLTLKPAPEGYRLYEGLPQCQSDGGCACGKTTCDKGKYCMNGVCFRDPLTRKSDLYKGKVLYYRISKADENEEAHEEFPVSNSTQHEWIVNLIQYRNSDDMPDMDICDLVHQMGIEELELHEYKKNNPDQKSVCDNPKYKYTDEEIVNEAVHFIENCGTTEAPKDVATKYCYIRFNVFEEYYEPYLRLEFSGWQGEDFKWNEKGYDDD